MMTASRFSFWPRVNGIIGMAMLALGAAACGGGEASPAHITLPLPPVAFPPVADVTPGTWVVMGSSTAAGAGAPAGKGWVSVVQVKLEGQGVQIANLAKGSYSTYHGLSASSAPIPSRPLPDPAANIDQALLRNPVMLLLSYPTNDTANGFSMEETVSNILAIRAKALARRIPVLVLSTQPRNLPAQQVGVLDAIDAKLAEHLGPCLVNVRAPLAGPDGRLASSLDSGDGVHPNAAGHEKIAGAVIEKIDAGTCIRMTSAT